MMDGKSYILSDEEAATIERMRAIRIAKQAKREKVVEILRVAHLAYQWSVQNDAGLTFSTFCDDFGYESLLYSQNQIYEAVLKIIKVAQDEITYCDGIVT